MTTSKHGRAGELPPERLAKPREALGEDTQMMPSYEMRTGMRIQTPEGVTVIGEALRRVAPECAEFLIEIATSAPTAAQALRNNQARTTQVAEAVHSLGVQKTDLQSISLNVYNMYSPMYSSMYSPGYLPASSPMMQAL